MNESNTAQRRTFGEAFYAAYYPHLKFTMMEHKSTWSQWNIVYEIDSEIKEIYFTFDVSYRFKQPDSTAISVAWNIAPELIILQEKHLNFKIINVKFINLI